MFPDGNRTRVFPLARAALSQLSYRFDNQSTAARPRLMTDKKRVGSSTSCLVAQDSNLLAACGRFCR